MQKGAGRNLGRSDAPFVCTMSTSELGFLTCVIITTCCMLNFTYLFQNRIPYRPKRPVPPLLTIPLTPTQRAAQRVELAFYLFSFFFFFLFLYASEFFSFLASIRSGFGDWHVHTPREYCKLRDPWRQIRLFTCVCVCFFFFYHREMLKVFFFPPHSELPQRARNLPAKSEWILFFRSIPSLQGDGCPIFSSNGLVFAHKYTFSYWYYSFIDFIASFFFFFDRIFSFLPQSTVGDFFTNWHNCVETYVDKGFQRNSDKRNKSCEKKKLKTFWNSVFIVSFVVVVVDFADWAHINKKYIKIYIYFFLFSTHFFSLVLEEVRWFRLVSQQTEN